jgi:hypothetical protein
VPKSVSASRWKELIQGTTIQVGVKNLFSHAPPYDAVFGIAPFWYSTYGSISLAEYYLTVKKDL